jgi:hypothetical protein
MDILDELSAMLRLEMALWEVEVQLLGERLGQLASGEGIGLLPEPECWSSYGGE